MKGVVLYGAPASGKDTVAAALHALDDRYEHYRRVKHGPGRTTGYRMVSRDELDRIRSLPGEVLWETRRYESTYLLVRGDVLDVATSGVPVVALGEPEAVNALTGGTPAVSWTVVELRCSRATAAERIAARGTGDDETRMAIYDATPQLSCPQLTIDTAVATPEMAARRIHQAVSL